MSLRPRWDKKLKLRGTKVWAKIQEVHHQEVVQAVQAQEDQVLEDLKISTICRGFKVWIRMIREEQECDKDLLLVTPTIEVLHRDKDLLVLLHKVDHLQVIRRIEAQVVNQVNQDLQVKDLLDQLQEQEIYSEETNEDLLYKIDVPVFVW